MAKYDGAIKQYRRDWFLRVELVINYSIIDECK